VADGQALLALTSGANRVDTARLAELARADRVRRADADEVREATGFAIGGTPPFGHRSRLPTYLDVDLLRHEEVWAAAGTPDSVFKTTARELLAVTGATASDFRER
jgi:prolyl-tRNA editing enzyme YbaK/EbsC (Cys-tRNA(Pro) deacylase)